MNEQTPEKSCIECGVPTLGMMGDKAICLDCYNGTRKTSPIPEKSSVGLKPSCSSCGVPWDHHLGIAGTCAKNKELELALKIARDALEDVEWGSFIGGNAVACCPSCEAVWINGKGHGLDCPLKKDLDIVRATLSLASSDSQTTDNALNSPKAGAPPLAQE